MQRVAHETNIEDTKTRMYYLLVVRNQRSESDAVHVNKRPLWFVSDAYACT